MFVDIVIYITYRNKWLRDILDGRAVLVLVTFSSSTWIYFCNIYVNRYPKRAETYPGKLGTVGVADQRFLTPARSILSLEDNVLQRLSPPLKYRVEVQRVVSVSALLFISKQIHCFISLQYLNIWFINFV